ncbi:MAG: 4Fe-4S dicluster domain-containing protein [Treponema sp.]
MEPVKGGGLVNLPSDAKKIFDDLHGGSYASYAVRFAASFPNICVVLSGMGSMEMMKDNISFMKDFKTLDEVEMNAVVKVTDILRNQHSIPCTACHYCTDGCPKHICIPNLFADYNAKIVFKDWNSDFYYGVHTTNAGKASECIKCGKCEKSCPQHLSIRKLLETVCSTFEH